MRNEKGLTLIGVIIALALLGIIAVAFLGALATASNALIITDERSTAESIARTQMEYLKTQEYIPATDYDPEDPDSGQVTYEKISGSLIPEGYIICSVNHDDEVVCNTVYGVPWDSHLGLVAPADTGLQRIKLVIKLHDKEIITLEDYKVNR